jgi:hypothetical protein
MRGGVFSSFCGALLLAQDVLAYQPVSVAGHSASKWAMRRDGGSNYACKCYPGDACWPNSAEFQKLNSTVGGNLQINIPPGAPCYNTFEGPLGTVNTYDAAACAKVTASWADEQFQ